MSWDFVVQTEPGGVGHVTVPGMTRGRKEPPAGVQVPGGEKILSG